MLRVSHHALSVLLGVLVVGSVVRAQDPGIAPASPVAPMEGPTSTTETAVATLAVEPPDAQAAASAPAEAAPRAHERRTGWRFEAPVLAQLATGVMVNYLTLPGRSVFVQAGIESEPSLERGAWRFQLPVELRHRQAFVTPWTESIGRGAIQIRYRPVRRFHIEAVGGVIARFRPAWLDQYQPITPGNLSTTHRYSRWSRYLGVEIGGMPIHGEHLRLEYRYSYMNYWADPNYDPWLAPTHLVPYDHTQHLLDASWHHLKGKLRVGGGVVARHRNYYFAFARDEGTGLTHAAGFNPNPLMTLWYLAPSVDARIDLSDAVRWRVAYAHEIQRDTFDGYFTYQGPYPSTSLELSKGRRWKVELDASMQWRRYGPGSYQAGAGHPPLEDGRRRYAHRWSVRATATYAVTSHAMVFVDAGLVVRNSNRPDYVPGVYPQARQYLIDFDYTNFRMIAGIRARL